MRGGGGTGSAVALTQHSHLCRSADVQRRSALSVSPPRLEGPDDARSSRTDSTEQECVRVCACVWACVCARASFPMGESARYILCLAQKDLSSISLPAGKTVAKSQGASASFHPNQYNQ